MPLLNSLATPYAEALLQVTEARGESETVADQCKQLLAIWNDSEDFRDAMALALQRDGVGKTVVLSRMPRRKLSPRLWVRMSPLQCSTC